MSQAALAQEYRSAAHAFVLHDHSTALTALGRALSSLSQITSSSSSASGLPIWIDLLVEHDEHYDDEIEHEESQIQLEHIRRKLAILQITLLATLASLDFAPLHSSTSSIPKQFEQIYSIWVDKSSNRNSLFFDSLLKLSINDVYNVASINLIPPSVMVALLSAGIKIGSFDATRSATENWMSNIHPLVHATIENAAVQEEENDENTNNDLMSLSTVSISDQQQSQPGNTTSPNSLHTSYLRLITLYSVHLLPRLNQYDHARESILLSGRSNGGLLSQHHIDQLLSQLEAAKLSHADQQERKRVRALEQKEKQFLQQQQQQQLQQQRAQQTPSPQSRQHFRTKSSNSNKTSSNSHLPQPVFPSPPPSSSQSPSQSKSPVPSSSPFVRYITTFVNKINTHLSIRQDRHRLYPFILIILFLIYTIRKKGRLFNTGNMDFSLLSLFSKLFETIKMVSGPPYI